MVLVLTLFILVPVAGTQARPGVPAKGKFLVASHDLRDPSFERTVVLLLEHGPEGTLGVIVNRPTERTLAELMPDVEGAGEREDAVYIGGPVLLDHMLMLVRSDSEPEDSKPVMDGVYYSASRELLAKLVGEGGDDFLVFAGHAGWAAGQLEWELKTGSWHVLTADSESVFDIDPSRMWDELIRRTTGLLA